MRLGLLSPLPGYVTQSPYPMTGLSGLGLGDVSSDQQAAGIATSLATTTVGIMSALHVVIAGTAMAGPIGVAVAGAIAAVGAIATVLIKEFSGCGNTCVIASQDANKYGDMMTQNLQAYLSSPIHFQSLQQAALNNFDALWAVLQRACSDPSLGTAGQKCISDREQGACTWKSTPGGWSQVNGQWTYTAPGPAGSGDTCWNYFVGMRDPIANDPSVVPDPVPTSTTGTTVDVNGNPISAVPGANSNVPMFALIGGAALLAYALTQ